MANRTIRIIDKLNTIQYNKAGKNANPNITKLAIRIGLPINKNKASIKSIIYQPQYSKEKLGQHLESKILFSQS